MDLTDPAILYMDGTPLYRPDIEIRIFFTLPPRCAGPASSFILTGLTYRHCGGTEFRLSKLIVMVKIVIVKIDSEVFLFQSFSIIISA